MRGIASMCAVVYLCITGCGQKNNDSIPKDSVGIGQSHVASPRGSGGIQDSSQIDDSPSANSLQYIAAVDLHGLLRPIARRTTSGSWTVAWPEPTGEDSVAPGPSLRVPRVWRFISLDASDKHATIHLRWMSGFRAFCGHDWAYVTDRTAIYSVYDEGIGQAAGFALSPALDSMCLVSDSTMIKRYDELRKGLKLWSNGKEGEGSYRFDLCGYFKGDGVVLGLGVSRGWEGESYVLFEVASQSGKIVLDVPGGGC